MKRYETDCGGCRVAVEVKTRKRVVKNKRLKFTKASYIGRMIARAAG